MTEHTQSTDSERAKRAIGGLAEAADRLGVEVDQREALAWLEAAAASEADGAVAEDSQTGIFGHRLALLDFNPDQLPFFRQLAQQVRAERHPRVESAIAISGSAAQGKVQLFPGDNDFFERVNIKADTLEEARQILRDVLRKTALRALGCATLCWWKSTWVCLISPCMRKDPSAPRGIPSPGCPPMWPMAT